MTRSACSPYVRLAARAGAALALVLSLAGAASAQTTYTWNASGFNHWTRAANWTPARNAPAANDVLVFDGAVAPNALIDSVATQTVGRVVVRNNAVISLQGPAATLTIAGGVGADLDIDAASTLMTLGGQAPVIALTGGATGAIAGRLDLGNLATATDAGALVFAAGSICSAHASPVAHVFGTTSLNSVVFQSGSTYESSGASDPFGAAAPLSVVTFQAGSTYKQLQTPDPSLSGRTYGNFVMNISGGGNPGTFTGTQAFTVDSLTVLSGHMHLKMPTVNIRGAIRAQGADLAFDAASAQAVNLGGSVPQELFVSINTFFSSLVTIHVTNPAGVEWAQPGLIRGKLSLEGGSVTIDEMFDIDPPGQLAFTSGMFHTGTKALILQQGVTITGVTPTSYVDGLLQKPVPVNAGPTALTFEVGDATTYAPVDLSIPSVTVAGTLAVSTAAGDHASIASSGIDATKSANRTWTIANNGAVFTPCTATFHFAPGDVDAGAQTSKFHVARLTAPSTWTPLPLGTRAATSTSTNNVASFGTFQVGEVLPPIAITVGAGSGKFGPTQTLPVPGYLGALAVADLDGDGRADLAVARSNNAVEVRYGLAGGGLGPAVDYPVSLGPNALALGDLNGDGYTDMVTSNYGVNDESILLNDGAGGFATSITQRTGANTGPREIADLNGDGFGDLIQVDDAGHRISVLLGDGTGHFAPAIQTALGFHLLNAAVGDLNEDGKPDLAVTTYDCGCVLILLGDGSGGFAAPTSYSSAISESDVIADFNRDGHLDLAVSIGQGSSVQIFLGDGHGNFGPAAYYQCGSNVWDLIAADFDGDGKLDLATATYSPQSVYVIRGDGAGGFAAPVGYPIGFGSFSLAAGDVTGDGAIDIVASSSTAAGGIALLPGLGGIAHATITPPLARALDTQSIVPGSSLTYDFTSDPNYAIADVKVDGVSQGPLASYTFTNLTASHTLGVEFGTAFPIHATIGSGEFAPRTDVPIAVGNWKTVLGDLNRDGHADLVTASGSSNAVSLLMADGAGGYATNVQLATPDDPTDVAITDLNRDGWPDLVVWRYFAEAISTFLNDGAGGFGARVDLPSDGAHSTQFALGDLNGDGYADAMELHYSDANLVTVRLGDGLGGFGAPTDIAAGGQPYGAALGDLNGDGHTDLVTVNPGPSVLTVQLGDGLGGFGAATNFASGFDPGAATIADLNHDGKADVAEANIGDGTVSVFLGDGAGQLSLPTTYPVGSTPYSVAAADLDGDGHLDLVVPVSLADSSIAVLYGDGHGAFQPCVRLVGPEQPFWATVGDVDGDGMPDIVAPAYPFGYVSVLKGRGGALTSGGTTYALPGSNPTFAITPGSGFAIARVRVDGVDQGAVSNVSLTNVSAPHAIAVNVRRDVTGVPGPPLPIVFGLDPPRPNPGRVRDLSVSFALPVAAPAWLEVFDVAGRIVSRREVGALGVGPHSVRFAGARTLGAGVYWVRLTQGGRQRTQKAVVLP